MFLLNTQKSKGKVSDSFVSEPEVTGGSNDGNKLRCVESENISTKRNHSTFVFICIWDKKISAIRCCL